MLRACLAHRIVSYGVLAVLLSGIAFSAASARDATKKSAPKASDDQQSTQTAPSPAAEKNAPASKTARKGVRIELKVPPIPGVSGSTAKTPSKSWPKMIPEAEAEKKALLSPPEEWAAEDVAAAKARCTEILKRINAIAIPQPPIKEGQCGTPAPIQLISIGRNPEVALSPPAIVNCEFAEALQSWMQNDVQPLAQKHFNNKVIKIEVMGSYSCRNAYGRKSTRLSEHALANALDIRGFVTAGGRQAFVLEHWGTTQREVLARIEAEKAKAAKAQAAAEAAAKAAQTMHAGGKPSKETPPSATASSEGDPAGGVARKSIIDGVPRITITLPGGRSSDAPTDDQFSLSPNRLGGPKDNDKGSKSSKSARSKMDKDDKGGKKAAATTQSGKAKSSGPSEAERRRDFLHEAHAAGCRLFGTTLGPEANAAHRNHLHIDMAPRKHTKICD